MSEDDIILKYRPISSKRMKMMHIETYNDLLDILKELTDKKEQNYQSWYWDFDTHMDQCVCTYCSGSMNFEEKHTDDCPIKRGQELLRSL